MPSSRKQLWIDLGCVAVLLTGAGVLCYLLGSVLVPFAVSAFVAYLLLPVVEFLEHRGLSRLGAVMAIYGGGILLLTVGAFLLTPKLTTQIQTFRGKLPQYSNLAHETLLTAQRDLESHVPELQRYRIAETIEHQVAAYVNNSLKSLPQVLLNAFTLLSIVVIVPFMTWYLLLEGSAIKKALISLVPNRYFENALNLIYLVDINLSAYLLGQLMDALIIGLLSAVAYSLIGVHYGMVIGLLSGVANLIPYVGPVAGASIAVLVTVLEVGITAKVFVILIVAAAIQVVDNFLVQPALMSKSVDLHPLAVIAILLIAGSLWGLWGMLLGIPAYCAGKIFVEELKTVVRRESVDAI